MVLLDIALGESLHPAVHALPRLLWLAFEVHRLDLKRNTKLGILIEIASFNRFWEVKRKTYDVATCSARASKFRFYDLNGNI